MLHTLSSFIVFPHIINNLPVLPAPELRSSTDTDTNTDSMFVNLAALAAGLEDFEIVDRPAPAPKDPYEWEPPHWVPNPVPADYDIMTAPWLRPEQVPMSFVGGFRSAEGG